MFIQDANDTNPLIITKLPEVIKEMKGLKTLKLWKAFDESIDFDIDTLRAAMPWCNISE